MFAPLEHPPRPSEQFAEALSHLIGEAEDAGMPSDLIAAELGAMAEAMRQCMEE
jgi:hypothetical protein